ALFELGDGGSRDARAHRLRRFAAGPGQLDVVGLARPASSTSAAFDTGGAGSNALLDWAAPYDYVLIDAPTDDGSAAEVARLSDLLAVCFTPRSTAIRHAADL